jgi:hypothetical protein
MRKDCKRGQKSIKIKNLISGTFLLCKLSFS